MSPKSFSIVLIGLLFTLPSFAKTITCNPTDTRISVEHKPDESRMKWLLEEVDSHIKAKNCATLANLAESITKEQLSCGGWSKNTGTTCTLDNGITFDALEFLMDLEAALGSKTSRATAIHRSLRALMKSQYEIGGFPQDMSKTSSQKVIERASYPDGYPRKFKDYRREEKWNYSQFYTLNDGVHSNAIEILLKASLQYNNADYLKAAVKAGDFLIRAQMPAPQRGWAQQYDFKLRPTWARAHEIPALSTRETAQAAESLILLAKNTKDKRFCAPALEAITWLDRTLTKISDQISEGPRWIELKSGKRIYLNGRDSHANPFLVESAAEVQADWREKDVNKFNWKRLKTVEQFATVCK